MNDSSDHQLTASPPPDDGNFAVENPEQKGSRIKVEHLTLKGLLLEFGLAVLAIGLACLGLYDHQQTLAQWATWPWAKLLLIGVVGAVPMLLSLVLIEKARTNAFAQLRDIVDELLVPLFKGMPVWKLFLIAASAGIGEELLFRWCIQGGVAEWFANPQAGIAVSILVASLLFGLCHWLNPTYAVFAFLIGVYLGGMMVIARSFVSPAICHGIYDFVALVYLAHFRK